MICGRYNAVTFHSNRLGYNSQIIEEKKSSKFSKKKRVKRHYNNYKVEAINVGITPRPEKIKEVDLVHLKNAASIAITSKGLTQPHPFSGCIIVSREGSIQAQTYKKSASSESSECQGIDKVKGEAEGSTVYLNMESGEYNGDKKEIEALIKAKVSRVVIGMRHPLSYFRNKAICELQKHKIEVLVLSDYVDVMPSELKESAKNVLLECFKVNEALLHYAVTKYPMSILKYAMTLDGKIATSTGHSAWVTQSMSRQQVFKLRSESNAVIIGGNTQRNDNPRLTTRLYNAFRPTRIVLSKSLNLLNDANLWDVNVAPTTVMTQRGVKKSFQSRLRDKGVQVVEFDFLSPKAVAEYCAQKGFLQCLWECGGRLSAPAISEGVIHKVMAFVAPKIIGGGSSSPSPCGDLGFLKMTQALPLIESTFDKISNDYLIMGYLPSSGGLMKLENEISKGIKNDDDECYINFYKTWNKYGILSNFTAHKIWMKKGKGPHYYYDNEKDSLMKIISLSSLNDESMVSLWPSVENYYQAQKFEGVNDEEAKEVIKRIKECENAEAAAGIGRSFEVKRPDLVREDWSEVKRQIMYEALMSKFTLHEVARRILLSTGDKVLIEESPDDYYWGLGYHGTGENNLGKLLMEIRQYFKHNF